MRKKIKKKYLPRIIGLQLNSMHLVNPKRAAKKAFVLFCSPRRGRVKPEQESFLNNAKAEVVPFENKNLQTYHWKGNGKTVLLIHGWESNSFRWHVLVEKLQKENYNIVAFDAPAHGYSEGSMIDVPMYSRCVEKMVQKYKPHYLVGHSIGGMTTVYHQYQFPNNSIEKLVLLGPPSELSEIMDDYQQILRLKPRVMEDLENHFHKNLGYRFKEFSIANFAVKLQQQGLIVHDKYDKIAPYSASEAIHANWSNSTLISTEGAGHSLNNEFINSKIVEFFNL